MIEDLRFIERVFSENTVFECRGKILQAYDGHVWFDVPVVESKTND